MARLDEQLRKAREIQEQDNARRAEEDEAEAATAA
jgi:hypothetical protein